MRLWHQALISNLPRQQLLGQHRECCALRGNGWGKKHSTVDYVFAHSPIKLVLYHLRVMQEMESRGYLPDERWYSEHYRGLRCAGWDSLKDDSWTKHYYEEHDDNYLKECLENLERKGIKISQYK
jgi:uncharacterized protein (TIGR02328 family)